MVSLHDEALFKQPPPNEECPICLLTLPIRAKEQRYQTCCGKVICTGCIDAAYMADNRHLCPFCRTPSTASEGEAIGRLMNRVDADDALAIHQLGYVYSNGEMDLLQDYNKAMEL